VELCVFKISRVVNGTREWGATAKTQSRVVL